MKILQELVALRTRLGQESIEILQPPKAKAHTKMGMLYQALAQGSIESDRDACRLLYGNEKLHRSEKYIKLKNRFFWRLVNTLYFLDVEKAAASTVNKDQYECRKLSVGARILVSRAMYSAAAALAHRALKIALNHEFSAEAAECANVLAGKYALEGNTQLFEKYARLAVEWAQKYQAEVEANLYFMRVMSWYAANWSLQQHNLIEISNYIHQIDALRTQHNTNTLYLYYFRLTLSYAEVEQDYEKIIAVARELRAYFEQRPQFSSKPTLAMFLIPAMAAHIWRREFEQAFALAKECNQYLAPGMSNWFTFQEYYLILALRSGNYTLAQTIFVQVLSQPRFDRSNRVAIEKWRLMEFYVRFVSAGEIVPTLMPTGKRGRDRHFRAFASTLNTLSKDLTGFNIAAVFAHILYLLRIGDFDALIERDESLQTLRRKRLDTLNYRLGVFARMIHQMVESNFDYNRTRHRTRLWLQKLHKAPQQVSGVAEAMEVIPLEELWEMMMAELQKHEGKG